MIINSISDQHGYLPKISPCDLLLIAGDICPADNHKVAYQQEWLDTIFRKWLETVPAKNIVAVAGNHDFVFDIKERYAPIFENRRPPGVSPPDDLPWHYLEDESITIDGYKIHGTPWQPVFGHWAFNMYEHDLKQQFSLIDEDVDIIVAHGPPSGYGDRTINGDSVGSTSLLQRIEQIKPQLVVCGHIHEDHGQWQYGPTTIANTTVVNLAYEHVYGATRFEL